MALFQTLRLKKLAQDVGNGIASGERRTLLIFTDNFKPEIGLFPRLHNKPRELQAVLLGQSESLTDSDGFDMSGVPGIFVEISLRGGDASHEKFNEFIVRLQRVLENPKHIHLVIDEVEEPQAPTPRSNTVGHSDVPIH